MMMRSAVALLAAVLCAVSANAFVAPVGRPSTSTARHMRAGRRTYAGALSMSSVALPPSPTSAATQEPSRSNVQALRTNDEFAAATAAHQDKLVVVKFYDQFCRACDEIRPRFDELSQSANGEDAVFFELEFSGSKDLCKQLGIRRLPTVQIYSGADGRVADLPAGPSRFNQVEERLAEVLASKATVDANVAE